MKVIKKYYGICSKVVNTEKRFGEGETYLGVWTKFGIDDRYIFLSDYEIRRFSERTQKHPELIIPRRKRFLLIFKKGKALPGRIYDIQNKSKLHANESNEYLGFWIIKEQEALFLLMTNDDFSKIVDRSINNEEDIPKNTYK